MNSLACKATPFLPVPLWILGKESGPIRSGRFSLMYLSLKDYTFAAWPSIHSVIALWMRSLTGIGMLDFASCLSTLNSNYTKHWTRRLVLPWKSVWESESALGWNVALSELHPVLFHVHKSATAAGLCLHESTGCKQHNSEAGHSKSRGSFTDLSGISFWKNTSRVERCSCWEIIFPLSQGVRWACNCVWVPGPVECPPFEPCCGEVSCGLLGGMHHLGTILLLPVAEQELKDSWKRGSSSGALQASCVWLYGLWLWLGTFHKGWYHPLFFLGGGVQKGGVSPCKPCSESRAFVWLYNAVIFFKNGVQGACLKILGIPFPWKLVKAVA